MKITGSESKFLERSRIALDNSESNPEIKEALAEVGITDEKFAEGRGIYNKAKESWELNKQEKSETALASNAYRTAYEGLETNFKRHRDLTLILCKRDPDTLIQLGVKGSFPKKYNEFFDKTKLFYSTISENKEIQVKLKLIKLTPKVAKDCLAVLDTLLTNRADFDREMGESQAATVSKDAALHELDEWMDEFDTMAKIALYDTPQRLEVLGVLVKS